MTYVENKRLDHMEDKLDNLEGKVDKILAALTGDDLKMGVGLIKQYEILSERITRLEALKNKVIWMAAGAGVTGGITLVKLIQWIQGGH